MKPDVALSITDRYRLKELTLEQSGTVPAGRVMWCRDRKVLGFGNVSDLPRIFGIPKGANRICLSAADFADVKEWLG
jgi:hypothetical protein